MLVSSSLNHFPIAIDAEVVKDIRDTKRISPDDPLPRLDLAAWFGISLPKDLKRKILVVDEGKEKFNLTVGPQVYFNTILLSQLRKIPTFIDGFKNLSGIIGIIMEGDEKIRCLLDGGKLFHAAVANGLFCQKKSL